MNDRIEAWLDGELQFEELAPAEQAEARALTAILGAASARFTSVPTPDLAARVMNALPPVGATSSQAVIVPTVARPGVRLSVRDRLVAWLPSGGLRLRPALALAAMSLTIGFALGQLTPRATTGDAAPHLFVRFELEAAGATEVRLAGSFTGWEPQLELTPLDDERWSVTVPLQPGVHDYVFIVDGERYVIDPHAARVADGFGGYNSRLALLTPED
jgi:hypothetical protein